MKKMLFLAITMLIGLSSTGTTAHAVDPFTFTIPYTAQNLMPEVKELEFTCYVYKNKVTMDSTNFLGFGGYGTKVVTVDTATGNASGTVQVGVTMKPGILPIDMGHYYCGVKVRTSPTSAFYMNMASPWAYTTPKPGTPLRITQEGPLNELL